MTGFLTGLGNLDPDRCPQGGCPVKREAERGDACTSEEHQRLPADQQELGKAWTGPPHSLRRSQRC